MFWSGVKLCRFYEDFYRVVVQNEKFEDWFPTLTLLRQVLYDTIQFCGLNCGPQTFTDYSERIRTYHTRPGLEIPPATNSTAAQGNFLEVLNISLNTFEKHFINRNLDRTGQQAIVITPGVGIFEVDRDLNVITKQRIIDSGVGSDLICVGEQPLHAVPLFRMHSRTEAEAGAGQDSSSSYLMPHWINLSFYTTNRKIGYSSFQPRIKLPPLRYGTLEEARVGCHIPRQAAPPPESPFGQDEHDAQVFVLPNCGGGGAGLVRKSLTGSSSNLSSPRKAGIRPTRPPPRTSQDDSVLRLEPAPRPGSYAIAIPPYRAPGPADTRETSQVQFSKSFAGAGAGGRARPGLRLQLGSEKNSLEEESHISSSLSEKRGVFGSAGNQLDIKAYLLRPGRALINPFDPSHVRVKLTSNRRRWTHIFPKGSTTQ